MDQLTPSIGKLIIRDPSIKSALWLMLQPAVFYAFYLFAGRDILSSFSARYAFLSYVPHILIGLSIAGALWLVYRYSLVMITFRDGITVKGNIIRNEYKYYERSKGGGHSEYFAIVGYQVNGSAVESRIRLPGTPESYAITEGMNVDLIVREEKPKTAFIKHIYLD